jgi:methylated-DNA-[protein]-cysteine S-methyltransferase
MLEVLHFDSPLGRMVAVGSNDCLHGLYFLGQHHLPDIAREPTTNRSLLLHRVRKQLDEYFAGQRRSFDVALNHSGTDLQQSVWTALAAIPYGQTVTYSTISNQIGRPRAVRAVAQAIGRNPWLIIRPCHRVVGANGSLTGFAAGLERKAALLAHEAQTLSRPARSRQP